ncbi:MAG: trigger factor [Parachlamydiales bacterium]|nr:trigger factor [Parachlamydiales bacterium]
MSSSYQNELVRVTVEEKPNCLIEMEVVALPSCLEKAFKAALKEVKKEVSIKGFRKGKAPDNVLLERYAQEIESEKKRLLANIAFSEAEQLVKILPLSRSTKISYDLKSLKEDEAVFSFHFETKPKAPSVDVTQFKLKEIPSKPIEEKQIDETIRQSQFFFATWEEIQNRPVQEGDFILADIETDDENPQKVFSNTRFEVSDKGMAQWMKKLVIGKNIHTPLHGISEPDPDASEEDKKTFEPKKVKVTVTKIENPSLPPLDDAFAQRLGVQTIDELKKSIRKMLEEKETERIHAQKSHQIDEFLLTHFSFDLPLSLVNSEKEHRLEQVKNDPQFNARWKKMSDEEKAKIEEDIATRSRNSILLYFLSEKIVADANIKISDEEIRAQAVKTSQTSDPQKISADDYALALSQLMLQKAEEHIMKAGS